MTQNFFEIRFALLDFIALKRNGQRREHRVADGVSADLDEPAVCKLLDFGRRKRTMTVATDRHVTGPTLEIVELLKTFSGRERIEDVDQRAIELMAQRR